MKKKFLLFCFFIIVFSVMISVPAFAECDNCHDLQNWDEPDDHCPQDVRCDDCVWDYCADCGEEYPVEYCDNTHEWSMYNYDVITSPTCYSTGLKEVFCERCMITYELTMPKVAHSYVKKATSSYLKSAATCASPALYYTSCTYCGQRGTSTFTSGSVSTTNHTGSIVNGGTADVHSKYNCCGVIASATHSYSSSVYSNPTCIDMGVTQKTCSCGYSYTETNIPALGHIYVDTVTPSTCVQEGYTTHECSRCEDVYTDTPTPLAEHSWSETSREVPTCLNAGAQHYECSVCLDVRTDLLAALGHAHDIAEVVPPTCTEIGYTLFKCIRCDDSYTDLEKAATGHLWIETDREEPTCTNVGNQDYECSVCHLIKTETISALGHSFEQTETIPPTCIKQGYTINQCIRCEEHEIVVGSFVATVDHEFRNGVCSMCGVFSSNGDDSSNRNDILSDDEEEQGIGKKTFSLLLVSTVAGFPAYLYDRLRKKGRIK